MKRIIRQQRCSIADSSDMEGPEGDELLSHSFNVTQCDEAQKWSKWFCGWHHWKLYRVENNLVLFPSNRPKGQISKEEKKDRERKAGTTTNELLESAVKAHKMCQWLFYYINLHPDQEHVSCCSFSLPGVCWDLELVLSRCVVNTYCEWIRTIHPALVKEYSIVSSKWPSVGVSCLCIFKVYWVSKATTWHVPNTD